MITKQTTNTAPVKSLKKKLNIQRDHKTKIDIGECLKKWINGISQDYRLDSKDVMMTHSYHIKETTLP